MGTVVPEKEETSERTKWQGSWNASVETEFKPDYRALKPAEAKGILPC